MTTDRRATRMTLDDLVQAARAAAPEQAGKMPAPRARALLAIVFAHVARRLEQGSDEALDVPGLGRFVVRDAHGAHDGNTATPRRIVFQPADPARR